MEFGCEVDAVSRSGDTPLSIMIQKDRLECVMTLLSRNASTLKAGKDGNTPLHLAIAVSSDIISNCLTLTLPVANLGYAK